MKTSTYNFDDSLKIGDIVVDNYSGFIGEITAITPRFLENDRGDGKKGEEYNPLVEIKQLTKANGTVIKNPKRLLLRDGGYTVRLDEQFFAARYRELEFQKQIWVDAQLKFIHTVVANLPK